MDVQGDDTREKKRRRRTGCLTCRRRRVRCDEAKPTCDRCNAANVECLGYEQKRQVAPRPSKPLSSNATATPVTPAPASPAFTLRQSDAIASLFPKFRVDGLPLIALPSNPRPDQRPHARARDLLAYHQFLLRTLPLLFPAEHQNFWRDRLCEEAWELEYVFLAITALGGIHRGALMMSTTNKNDAERGVDSKVISVQIYTSALEQISENLQGAEQSLDILTGVLVVLAYFEVFFGNIPAAIGHVREATQYFARLRMANNRRWASCVAPIEFALRNLNLSCRIVLPLDILELGEYEVTAQLNPEVLSPSSVRDAPALSSILVQQLLDLADHHPEVRTLIWNPWAMHTALFDISFPAEELFQFQEQLRNWSSTHDIFDQFNSPTLAGNLSNCTWSSIDTLPIPPQPYVITSPLCLVACLYAFYMARICWALSLVDHDRMATTYELYAYCYGYEVMRSIATINNGNIGIVNDKGDGYLPCEAVRIGFQAALSIIGQCCPRPLWLQYIMGQLSWLGREGVSDGRVFARSLNALYTFEMSNNLDSSSFLDRFPPPASRVVSVLIPELDGQNYIAFYAAPDATDPKDIKRRYYPVGHARWANVRRGGSMKPDIEMYSEQRKFAQPVSREWLLSQQVAQDWSAWANQTGFSLDRALRDHISGSCLERAVFGQATWYAIDS